VDPRHFEQALAAIVGNAVEAAGDHGKVTIGLDSAGSDSQWSLYVADSGPGIPPEIRDRLFEPTFSTKKGGHGLGLALARRVVELHGGQISVECPPPRGTVFRIVMPAEPNARMLDG
jgi:signal transduction histidine kinase